MNRPGIIALIGLIVGIVVAMIAASTAELDQRETALLSLVLAIFSMVASWLATHLYSQKSAHELRDTLKTEHAENLRTYALNAAEKVEPLRRNVTPRQLCWRGIGKS